MLYTPHFGDCCERLVDAVCEQAKTLIQTFNYPYTVPKTLLAEKVCTTLGMDKIFYQNTGTGANEAMIKIMFIYGVKAIPHNYCRTDAQSGFSVDCIKSSQAYWRMSRDFCVI